MNGGKNVVDSERSLFKEFMFVDILPKVSFAFSFDTDISNTIGPIIFEESHVVYKTIVTLWLKLP